jgi:hypothetical protein
LRARCGEALFSIQIVISLVYHRLLGNAIPNPSARVYRGVLLLCAHISIWLQMYLWIIQMEACKRERVSIGSKKAFGNVSLLLLGARLFSYICVFLRKIYIYHFCFVVCKEVKLGVKKVAENMENF